MNVNIRDISGDTLDSLEQRRLVIKILARKMILETKFEWIAKWFIRIMFVILVVYCVYHDLQYDHFIHFHPFG
jgi:hypothetical protein